MAELARYRDLPGAEVASATLDAAGIPNTLADGYTIGMIWTYSTALGWIRVLVEETDLEEARWVLSPDSVVEWPEIEEPAEPEERCPDCSSADLAIDSGSRKTIALLLLIPFPIWFWRSRLRCRVCGFSRAIPVRIRPELIYAWLVSALIAVVLTAAIFLMVGYVAFGHRD